MIGKTLSHYKVLEKIGQGGMGEVYRAEDTSLKRDVAIKVLPEQFTKDPQRLARFEREAQLLAQLNHPNIAAIYGFEEADDVRFLAMELVEGETLQERVAKGPVPVDEALEVCRQIAEGVEAAHEKGVIHRDLKPANVKVTPEGKVKILDFGLAKAFEDEIPAADISQSPTLTEEMTRAGVILGTAAYMSPEQARGKSVDKKTDIFAFGSVLYELLTGKRAFEGETVTDTLARVLQVQPDWKALPEDTPTRVIELLTDCLEKDSTERLPDIGHVRIQIKKALRKPVGASTTEATTTVQPVQQRWGIAVGLVVGAVVTGLVIWSLMPPRVLPPLTRFAITPSLTAPLASTPENDLAISADGRHVLYRSNSEIGVQFYLHSLDGLVDRPIPTNTGGSLIGSPFFSPDGKSVAFFGEGRLQTVSLSGGSPIPLCDALTPARSGSWGPDGTIIFSAGSEVGSQLYRVSASGGETEILATPELDKGEGRYVAPHILPGGKAVLFAIARGPASSPQIAVLLLETGEQKILIEDGRQPTYVNTGHLIYEQGRTGNLMAVSFDLTTLEVTSGPVTVLQDVRQTTPGFVDYALSEEGTLVYVPDSGGTVANSLVRVDREGTERPLTEEKRDYTTPSISPDGKRIALAFFEDGERHVWIYDIERDSFSRLTFEGVDNSPLIWSSDGHWITFQSDRDGANSLYQKPADGSGPAERLTTSPNAQTPTSWSPDGSVLAFHEDSPETLRDIWLLPIEGDGKPQLFISSPRVDCCAVFSPDGQWLAYVSDEAGKPHVYVSPYPEPNVKWLVSGQEGGGGPVWSPDGTELFYQSGPRMEHMMVVTVHTEPTFSAETPQELFEGSYKISRTIPGFSQYYDISPDGQRFLMIKVEEEAAAGQINVVLNWFEELKRLVPTP